MSFGRSTSNLSKYYETIPYSATKISNELAVEPMLNNIFRNKRALQYNAPKILFSQPQWNGNPQQFCQDQYNDQFLYPVILIVNDLGSMYEFTKSNMPKGIIAPESTRIYNIINYTSPAEVQNYG